MLYFRKRLTGESNKKNETERKTKVFIENFQSCWVNDVRVELFEFKLNYLIMYIIYSFEIKLRSRCARLKVKLEGQCSKCLKLKRKSQSL